MVPVVILVLARTLDKSLKGARSLCLVRALHYYLVRNSDLKQNKGLVVVSFKKGFNKDISPATIFSWIKQTVILCYELSDQELLPRPSQIRSDCHWKSHNTFTQFYLKDVAWADSELFYLGVHLGHQWSSCLTRFVYTCMYEHSVYILYIDKK